jgi:hypothetical protein
MSRVGGALPGVAGRAGGVAPQARGSAERVPGELGLPSDYPTITGPPNRLLDDIDGTAGGRSRVENHATEVGYRPGRISSPDAIVLPKLGLAIGWPYMS